MPPRRRACLLGAHAVLVGVGWLPVVLVFLGSGDAQQAVRDLPNSLAAALVAVGLVFAVPLTWPALVAVGLFEGGLAERLWRGDEAAASTARRVLLAQAVAFAAVAAVAAAAGARLAIPGMWAGFLVAAGAHVVLAGAVGARAAVRPG